MTVFDDIRTLKGEGKYLDAWSLGQKAFQDDPDNKFLLMSLYWIAYAALKDLTGSVAKRENVFLTDSERDQCNHWCGVIRRLNIAQADTDIEFKYLFILFKNISTVTAELVNFVLDSGSRIFDENDHVPYKTEQGEVPSLVLWLARKVVTFVALNPNLSDVQRAHAFANYALKKTEDSDKGKLWLIYDLVSFYVEFGQIEKARDCARKVLREKKADGWAWNALGETYIHEPGNALKLYAKAILLSHDEKFRLKSLKNALALKAKDDDKTDALLLLNEIIRIYESSGWNLKEEVLEYTRASWFVRNEDTQALWPKLKQWSVDAENLCLDSITSANGVVTDKHRFGKKVFVYLNRHSQVWVERSLFPNGKLPENGTYLKLFGDFSAGTPLIVRTEPVSLAVVSDVEGYEGSLRVVGASERKLGFVEDVFVPPHLLSDVSDGDSVQGLAIVAFDKKKQKYGKKAITIQAI
ncbi:DUF7017 domain-containing protein [Idiomarina sp.]|uniref:DUF7017 domain-containing protein n=1 Tax=Idiomarina sp. TaxID=1874361 RepID=UPI003A95733F